MNRRISEIGRRCVSAVMLVAVLAPALQPVTVTNVGGVLTIANSLMDTSLTLSNGAWSARLGGSPILSNISGSIGGVTTNGFQTTYQEVNLSNAFGTGKRVVLTLNAGGTLAVEMYDNEYFFTAQLQRSGATGTSSISGSFNFGAPRTVMVWGNRDGWDIGRPQVRVFGYPPSGGPWQPNWNRSEFAIAIQDIGSLANPVDDRPGMLIGSLGIDALDPRCQFDSASNGMTFRAESGVDSSGRAIPFCFMVAPADKLVEHMEHYASLLGIQNDVRFTTWIPCGTCTWDSYGDNVSSMSVVEMANAMVSTRLREYGYTVLQIDDGWQHGVRESGSWWANRKFNGTPDPNFPDANVRPFATVDNNAMRGIADLLHARGLLAGLWIGPLVDADCPDWRGWCWGIQNPSFDPSGGGITYRLDLPIVRDYLTDLADKITNASRWNYDYIKSDFMYNGQGNIAARRGAYLALRQGMRPGTHMLYSNANQWLAINAVDSNRANDDVGYGSDGRSPFDYRQQTYTVTPAIRCVYQWCFNRKIWINDYDQVHQRAPLTMGQARIWSVLVGFSGGLILSGDRFWDRAEMEGTYTGTFEARLNLLKVIAPSYGVAARPIDLFHHVSTYATASNAGFPQVYVVPVDKPWGRSFILNVMNWNGAASLNKQLNLPRCFGSAPGQSFHVYDFFAGRYLGTATDTINVTVPAQDCIVYALVPAATVPQPQVVSTNRHITQGGVDLTALSWNSGTRQLSGTSTALVTGVPYTIAVYVPTGFTLAGAYAGGVPMQVHAGTDGVTRATISSPTATTVSWIMDFGSGGGDTTPPAAVQDLAVTIVGVSSVTLRWTAPGDDGTSGTATAYDVRYATYPLNESVWVQATQASGEPTPESAGALQTFTVRNLTAGILYSFGLKTADEVGNMSMLSNVVSTRTLVVVVDTTPPAAVADLAASSATYTEVSLAWTAPGDDGTVGTAMLYDIRYATFALTAGNWAAAVQAIGEPQPALAGTRQWFTVGGLSQGTTYWFALRTTDDAGNVSGLSNVVVQATLRSADTIPPAAIADLTVVNVWFSSMSVRWTAPGDDGTVGTAAQYDLRVAQTPLANDTQFGQAQQVSGVPNPAVAGTVQSCVVAGLSPGTTYYLRMRAFDEVNNASSLSNQVSTVTLRVPNIPPTAMVQTPPPGAKKSVISQIGISVLGTDEDGRIVRVEIYRSPGSTAPVQLLGESNNNPYALSTVINTTGTVWIIGRVYDDAGAVAVASVPINVAALPTVNVLSPVSGSTLTAPAVIQFSVQPVAYNGALVSKVDFWRVHDTWTEFLAESTAPPYTHTVSNLSSGTYRFNVRVLDDSEGIGGTPVIVYVIESTGSVITPPPARNVPSGEVRVYGGAGGYIDRSAGVQAEIAFTPRRDGTVNMRVYALDGREVYVALNIPVRSGVTHVQLWDGRNKGGEPVASGVYLVHLSGAGLNVRKKIAVVSAP
jgi:hypothetical protein